MPFAVASASAYLGHKSIRVQMIFVFQGVGGRSKMRGTTDPLDYVCEGYLQPTSDSVPLTGRKIRGTLRFNEWTGLTDNVNNFSVRRNQDNKLVVTFTIGGVLVGTFTQSNLNVVKGTLSSGEAEWMKNANAPAHQLYTGDVAPGHYVITSKLVNQAINLFGNQAEDDTPIIIYPECGTKNERWDLIPGDRGYRFRNAITGTYLSSLQVETVGIGTVVTGNRDPIEFIVQLAEEGSYYIRLASNPSLVVDIKDASTQACTPLVLLIRDNGGNQRWNFGSGRPAPGKYLICSLLADQVLDIPTGSSEDFTPITTNTVDNSEHQIWELILGDNAYQFKNVHTGTYLGYPHNENSQMALTITGNSNPVEFTIERVGLGHWIHPVDNHSLVLDIEGYRTQDGSAACLWSKHGGANQQWYFRA
ncbi:hypothetical protein FRB94_010734 [Tulasnella sp. JGI-2019a]|nr:hypothetical protein FRB94_010734 [Tulasnella sp. JGI-2019a]KAG8997025.1 hypothetical protein FRB93_000518 [Tulasnella sp. JGI-2019a]KAG9022935.1 hypothetical protein FRB95_013942 [Tulasnella sp. JGI-2019a]